MRALLRGSGLYPKKSFGQNFLVAESVIASIARACVLDAELGKARVVELGAGLGALTAALLERAKCVIAVERDRDLVPVLTGALGERENLRVIEADAQTVDLSELLGGPEGD